MIMVMIAKSCPILDFQDFEGQKFHFQFSNNKSYWANIEKGSKNFMTCSKTSKHIFFCMSDSLFFTLYIKSISGFPVTFLLADPSSVLKFAARVWNTWKLMSSSSSKLRCRQWIFQVKEVWDGITKTFGTSHHNRGLTQSYADAIGLEIASTTG